MHEQQKIAAQVEDSRRATAEHNVIDLAFAARMLNPSLMLCHATLESIHLFQDFSIEAWTRYWLHPMKHRCCIVVVIDFDLTKVLGIGESGKFGDSIHETSSFA